MEALKELMDVGTKLGYAGDQLKQFVKEQQDLQRDERAKLRIEEKEARDAEMEKLRLQVDAEREKIKLLQEAKVKDYELQQDALKKERDEKEREHEMAMEIIEAKGRLQIKGKEVKDFDKGPKPPKLPYFNDNHDDMDAYLQRFERYAASRKWEKCEWAINLSALLQGKALEVYARLPPEDALDYEKLKAALLIRFELTIEGFRKRFKTYKPEYGETFSQFSARIKNYLMRWIELSDTEKSFDGLVDLLLRDQLIRVCSSDLQLYLRERAPDTTRHLTNLADQYREARGGNILNVIFKAVPKPTESGSSTQRNEGPKQFVKNKMEGEKPLYSNAGNRQFQATRGRVPVSEKTCYLCHRKGHLARDCRTKISAVVQLDEKPEETSLKTVVSCCITPMINPALTMESRQENREAMTKTTSSDDESCGLCMPVAKGDVGGKTITVLRDTGCSGVVVRKSLVKESDMTGSCQQCVLADGTVRSIPVAEISVDSPFFQGRVKAMCMESPVYDLILGNIDGVRDPSDPDPEWSLSNAVITRIQAKKADRPVPKLKVPDIISEVGDAESFKIAQQEDASLESLRTRASDGVVKTNKKGKFTEFKYKEGLLYRSFHVPSVQNDKHSLQLVIPKAYREIVMKYAHETLLAGHLGSRKTTDRTLAEFFWPGIYGDVARFCRSCNICQRTMPKGKVIKVPLGSMPIIGTPFERVAIDIIGPISPPTDRRNRYIITLMDYATRYPEAIALPQIGTIDCAEALLDMFSRLGIPSEVLSDMGPQFVSELMTEVSRLLSFRQLTTTPYHPMCNGLVERFNGTLKSMLRKMCAERPKDWDRYLNPLLFAYREAPQESLGFSPFELLYGRTVRGPMAILKEFWTKEVSDQETKTTYQYVLDLRQRLENTCQWAHEQLKTSAGRYKKDYDRKARKRQMNVGDKALVLLPTKSNKLLMQWKGPFSIVEKLNSMDYRLHIHGKVKTFHANMLKKFIERPKSDVALATVDNCQEIITKETLVKITDENKDKDIVASVAVVENTEDGQGGEYECELSPLVPALSGLNTETIDDVNICDKLCPSQVQQVKDVLSEFRDVLSDQPGRTTFIKHDVQTTTNNPVRVKQYPLPYQTMVEIEKEVETMLNMGVIVPSDSPYSAPIVIVKKKDGSNRFCIDYRRLNRVTVFDPEPIPSIETIFTRLVGKKYFSKFDLTKGYWQVPLTERASMTSAFSVPNMGHFRFLVLPFGMVNAPATFTRLMRLVLKGLKDVDNFIDDSILGSIQWEDHLGLLRQYLQRLREAGLTAKPSKIFIGYDSLDCFGHEVGNNIQKPHTSKVEAIQSAPIPRTKKQVRSFLGLVGFYRKFVPNFAEVALPLTDLTRKGEPNYVRWSEPQEKAFRSLKSLLTVGPILRLPDISKSFIVRTDASDRGLGAILLQEDADVKWPVAYASRKLLQREINYSTIERECLAIVWGILKFQQYLYGREFLLETDHQPLQYLQQHRATNSRLMRWSLLLQPYRFVVKYIKGSENQGADYLSRLC